MAKKILYTVLGTLLVFGVLFMLWSWFFASKNKPAQTGTFGTASSTQNGGASGAGQNTNGQAPLGNNSTNGVVNLNQGGTGGVGTAGGGLNGSGNNNNVGAGSPTGIAVGGVGSGTSSVVFTTPADGVDWLISGGGVGGGSTFSPTAVNSVTGGNVSGSVSLIGVGGIQDPSGSGSNLGTALLAAGITGAAVCGAQALAQALASTPEVAPSTASYLEGVAAQRVPTAVPVMDASSRAFLNAIAYNTTQQSLLQGTAQKRSFLDCIARTIAKATLQQITGSIVNWINSGFNGQPGFVQNYNQFFTNVADLAAGQFIQSSGLAFLCSPFRLQIRIAIAQSYANRYAQSCTLTTVIRNINGFFGGNFSQGGWPGFLSVTTMPLNNPYGAYAYSQISLGNAQANALFEKSTGLSLSQGFLPVEKKQQCDQGPTGPINCRSVIVTPGSVVAASINDTLKIPRDELGLAKNFDEIINALMSQLMTKVLYNGLASGYGQNSISTNYLTPEQQQAQAQAQSALLDMQDKITLAQSFGAIQQGSIRDIQNAQANLSSLENCWSIHASSSALSSSQQTQAASNAAAAHAKLAELETQIIQYNEDITQANQVIVTIQEFQTQALSVATIAEVQSLLSSYSAAKASSNFVTQADITTAQQNRTTLQSQMSTINASTQTGLAQCNAFV